MILIKTTLHSGQYYQAESNFKGHFPKDDRVATGKFHKKREPGTNCSEDHFARRTHRKQLHVEKRRERSRRSSSANRDKVTRHSDRFNDGFLGSSDRRRREIHQHHFRDSRKRHERDSHHKHFPSSAHPVHQTARSKERRGFGHEAKHSRHHARHFTDEVRDNKKWKSSSFYEDCRDGYHHKRKRDHWKWWMWTCKWSCTYISVGEQSASCFLLNMYLESAWHCCSIGIWSFITQ